jgi:hypothetical protein
MAAGLQVSLNGNDLVTVSSNGLNMLNVRVNGIRANQEFAELDVTGGWYGGEQESKHFLWEADRPISPGDEISVTFVEDALTSRPGSTIEEVYPKTEEQVGPPPSVEQIFELRAREPLLRDGYVLTLRLPSCEAVVVQTLPEEWDFGYSVNWVWLHPERVTVRLSTTSLNGIRERKDGRTHARLHLAPGERVSFRVEPLQVQP